MREYNEVDQWSEDERTLRSKPYQQTLAAYCVAWKAEEDHITSCEDLVDAIIDEILKRNKADLFDYKKIYLDQETRSILGQLREDTRHQMGRLLAKATNAPKRRLQKSLIDFNMWVDLAMKCREARKEPEDKPTAS